MIEQVCGGKINSIGVCEKCLQTSQSSSGQCVRLVEALSTKGEFTGEDMITFHRIYPYYLTTDELKIALEEYRNRRDGGK